MRLGQQAVRFAVVGIVSNGILYCLYLVLTRLGMAPKPAMTACFIIGVLQTFFLNRSWTFRFRGAAVSSLVRYWIAYAAAYFANYAGLAFFVDRLHLPHEAVQGVMIVSCAALLFLAHRYWVFKPSGAYRNSEVGG
jgi:putative flippase GtrA